MLDVRLRVIPPLDPGFVPASVWNRAFLDAVKRSGRAQPLAIALERTDRSVSVYHTHVFPHEGDFLPANERYVERLVKFLLWQKGGYKVTVAGDPRIAAYVKQVFSPTGKRAFDFEFMGERVYGAPMAVSYTHLTLPTIYSV